MMDGMGVGMGWEWGWGWDGSGDRVGVQFSPWLGPPTLLGSPMGFCVSLQQRDPSRRFLFYVRGEETNPGPSPRPRVTPRRQCQLRQQKCRSWGGSAAPLLVSPGWEPGLPSGPPRREGLLFDPAPQSCEPGAEFYGLLLKIGNGESIPWGSDPLRGTDGQWGPRDAARPPRCHDSGGRPARMAPP